jgi:hypothetical protein
MYCPVDPFPMDSKDVLGKSLEIVYASSSLFPMQFAGEK